MNKRMNKRSLTKLENPLDHVFPDENIKRAMERSHAAILVAEAALLKFEASLEQAFDAAQEVMTAHRIAETAMDEAEHRANLRRK
ncbi:hypothetical protein Q3C01_12305 [Bradyrhizobium sp. UFLA05-109]